MQHEGTSLKKNNITFLMTASIHLTRKRSSLPSRPIAIKAIAKIDELLGTRASGHLIVYSVEGKFEILFWYIKLHMKRYKWVGKLSPQNLQSVQSVYYLECCFLIPSSPYHRLDLLQFRVLFTISLVLKSPHNNS